MYIGYLLYMVVRKSFAFSMSAILDQGDMDKPSIGKVLSSFSMGYTIGKFGWGIVADSISPTLLFAVGLLVSSLFNIVCSYVDTDYFMVLWLMNGVMQGTGWPACAKLANSWYSAESLGSVWSLLSTCMNVASTGGLIFFSFYLDATDGEWRPLMRMAAVISCIFSAVSLILLKDSPDDMESLPTKQAVKKVKSAPGNPWVKILTSQYILILAWASCVTMYLKGALIDWGRIYIQEEKNGSSLQSSGFIATIEIGGLCGRLFSGFISDRLTVWRGVGEVGNPRNLWVIFSWFGEVLSLMFLRVFISDAAEQGFLLTLTGFLIGFFLYGVITIVGLLSMEAAAPDIKGKTFALCGLIGNVGLTMSGYPFSLLMENFAWNEIMYVNELLSLSNAVLFMASQWLVCKVGYLEEEKLA